MIEVGDKIIINYMEGEPNYWGREGIVTSIDSMGYLHGTWGGLAVLPNEDDYTLIKKNEIEEKKEMAKGQKSKEAVIEKILSNFEGAFLYNGNKEIRIPRTDDGEIVQIKIVITCEKDNVAAGADETIPGAEVVVTETASEEHIEPSALKVSEEEKNKAKALLAAMQF